jgi:hypothetical protein
MLVPDMFGLRPRRPAGDDVIGRAAGLLPALEELIDANLELRGGAEVLAPEEWHRLVLVVERAWVRALDAGWGTDELSGLGLEPPDAPEEPRPEEPVP